MRIVDTGVLVRANARSKGPARELLTAILNGPHTLITSPFLLAETERVLYDPRLRATLRLNEEDIREHLEFIRGVSELVEPAVTEPVVLSDPDDDPVLFTAVAGRADVLCSLDRHLRHADVAEFCRGHRITVLTDVELLHLIRPTQVL